MVLQATGDCIALNDGEQVRRSDTRHEGSLLSEIFGPATTATTLFSDNQAAIALTRDHQYHARTKHIDVRYHFIRWVIEQGTLRLIYCPTDDMVADTFTKALPSAKVKHFAAGLGLRAK
jgi:transposase